jgi:methylation protein EvaC
MRLGRYIMINKCSFCDCNLENPFLSLGSMELAGAFKKNQYIIQRKYPLDLTFCTNCFGVEVVEKISPEELFHDYFYFSSTIKTLVEHFEKYANSLSKKLDIIPKNTSVCEIGCNDGVLLKPLLKCGYNKVIGVDPARNVISEIKIDGLILYNDFFSEDFTSRLIAEHGYMDIILANNVFAHINNISSSIRAVKNLLSENGSFIFEVHYLLDLLETDQFDMIYHEHVYYYSVTACVKILSLYGLHVYDVEKLENHGGSLRVYAAHNSNFAKAGQSAELMKLLENEEEYGLKSRDRYIEFGSKVVAWREQFLNCLQHLKSNGAKIFGYGASGRANTLLQYCDLDFKTIEVMLDDNSAKQGHFTPGSNIPIKDPSYIIKDRPDVIVIFAWTFTKEITQRLKSLGSDCQLIVPLPVIQQLDEY